MRKMGFGDNTHAKNVSRSGDRELRGAAFSPTPKMGGKIAQAKIGQDRLILTMFRDQAIANYGGVVGIP